MGLNDTPMSDRIHIGFFGRRNAGKSSVVNAVTGQELAVVSDVKGTTTDPVYKAMELLPLGPVVIIDTPGIDDEGELGELRVKKTRQILNRADIAVLISDASLPLEKSDEQLIALFKEKDIPYIIVRNKSDLLKELPESKENECYVSALKKDGIYELKEKIAHLIKTSDEEKRIVGDLIKPSDICILVVPIDTAAPKGRIILPQQQTIRDILDANASAIVVKENELSSTFKKLNVKPAMVITDSQVFKQVSEDTPRDIPLTSFSILMARYKGFLDTAVRGAAALDKLKEGDKILISEGCTHHRQCDDIGTVKIPRWLKNYLGFEPVIETTSGREFPENVTDYSLVIHCGGCMLNEREMKYRMKTAADQGVPFTNYGICIAYMQGILKRSIEMLPDISQICDLKNSDKN
ncbi:[FeFe] hydrogenase H-cluster maturation GTPase HydF [Lachnospiraceae bacterium KH1T2]|nr:[FeFe] hydrogenase H-cluster maturation GTPase HydF [Lachnospiraceae bacterium KH1T2]